MPTKEQGYGIAAGGRDHPRAGRHAHGQRPEDVGAERELPGARREESVRRRRRPVRVAGRQEPDVDDPRARLAHGGLHRASSARRGHYERRRSDADAHRTPARRSSALLAALRACRRGHVAAAIEPHRQRRSASQRFGSTARDRRGRRRRTRRSSSPPHEWRTVRMLADDIIPRDERSGSATDAGCRSSWTSCCSDEDADGRSTCDARRARLARHRVRARASARTSSTRPTRSAADPRRHRVAAKAQAGDEPRRRVLQPLPRPDGVGFFSSADGMEGPAATSGNVVQPGLERCPPAALREARRELRRDETRASRSVRT